MLTTAEIAQRVAEFPRWHYQFDLNGVLTPIWQDDHINRHHQRERYFLDPLVELLGGSLEGKRVLDLGCNAGWWSLKAIEAGADFVLGIDGRQMHVDQANFVFEVKGVDPSRFEFRLDDLFAMDQPVGQFDIVMCLGLLYHVSKPMELFELIASAAPETVLVDTELHPVAGGQFATRVEDPDEPRNAVDRSFVMIPSAEAVHQLGDAIGYPMVTLDIGVIDNFDGMAPYRQGKRRAFIGQRGRRPAGLRTEPLPAADTRQQPTVIKRWQKKAQRLARSAARR
jgi:tRNA (mo5U34)-methyltransferase